MITNAHGTSFPSVLAAVKAWREHEKQIYEPAVDCLAVSDLTKLRAHLDAIIASAEGALAAVKAYAPDKLAGAEQEIDGRPLPQGVAVAAREMEAV